MMQRALLTLALALSLAFSLRAGDAPQDLTPLAQALSPTAAADLSATAQALSSTAAAMDLSPTAQALSSTAEALALSPTAALPEMPASLSSTAAPELPASLPEATAAPTPAPEEVMEFVAQPKAAPGFPWADTILAGFGGGLVGSTVAFFSAGAQNGDNVAGFQSQFQKTLPLYGGGGLVAGGLIGFFFGSGEPATPVPPQLKPKAGLALQSLDLAATPRGGAMGLRLAF
jgi:hypothetical protein